MSSGIASIGARGQSAPLDGKKIFKNLEKEGKNREKERKNHEKIKKKRKNREEKQPKSGRFFHFAPPDK